MVAALVRNHGGAAITNTASTYQGKMLLYDVAAGNVLIVQIAYDVTSVNDPNVVGYIACPSQYGQWYRLMYPYGPASGGSTWHKTEIWACKVPALWPSGSVIEYNMGATVLNMTVQILEFSGIADANSLRGIPASSFAYGSSTTVITSGSPIVAGDLVIGASAWNGARTPNGDADTLNGAWSAASIVNTSNNVGIMLQYKIVNATGVQSYTGPNIVGSESITADLFVFPTGNVPPNAPTLSQPIANATIDKDVTQRFSWVFSDTNPFDSQSKYDLQYRIGLNAWNTITTVTPNQFWDAPPGAFTAATYEWQVRTYDSVGAVGAYSASRFFTGATTPTNVTITAPTNNSTVTSTQLITWSTPTMTNSQIRRVADIAGAADTATVYSDTGDVLGDTYRAILLAFPVNNRWEHIQVRIKDAGLWSAWVDVRVNVSWTSPVIPVFTTTPVSDSGYNNLVITNPVGVAGEPVVVTNDIYRYDAASNVWSKIATVAPNATFRDYTVVSSGLSTIYYIKANGTNGTTSSSNVLGATIDLHGIWLHDPSDASGTVHRFAFDEGRSSDWVPETTMMEYVGREFPTVEFGTGTQESVSISLPLDSQSGDVNSMELLVKLRKILCYRDGRGRKIFGFLDGFSTSDTHYGKLMKFQFNHTDYNEFLS